MAGQLVVAATIEEALKAKQAGGVFLAGGTEINRLDSLVEAETLVSIRKIPELAAELARPYSSKKARYIFGAAYLVRPFRDRL